MLRRALPALLLLCVATNADAQSILTVAGGSSVGDGVPATQAVFRSPRDVEFDRAGNVYVVESGNNRVRRIDRATGIARTIAGGGTSGDGEGGPATEAELVFPVGLGIDSAGNIFVVAPGLVRRVDARTGIITTVAPGVDLGNAHDVAFDAADNLFIAEFSSNRVSRIDRLTGQKTIVAGTGEGSSTGDGGPATRATVNIPARLRFDAAGNLYISEGGGRRIRRVTPGGIITTVAGGGSGYGDGSLATEVEIPSPFGIAFDSSGNLVFNTGEGVYRVDTAGRIRRIAGSGANRGPLGDGGPALEGRIIGAWGMAIDAADDILVAEDSNNRVRRIRAADGIITTYAGVGSTSPDGVAAAVAPLFGPWGLAISPSGELYIAEGSGYRIRRFRVGGNITTVVGNGVSSFGDDEGESILQIPGGIAFDPAGNLHFVDGLRIRKLDARTGQISLVAGTIGTGFGGDGGPATAAVLFPRSIAFDTAGNLYIADWQNHRIRRVDTSGIITTVAGSGPVNGGPDVPNTGTFAGDGGPATAARLNQPEAVAVDAARNLYIADTANDRIRKVDASTGIITTVAGSPDGTPLEGSPAAETRIFHPAFVAFDAQGNLAFTTMSGVNRIDRQTGIVSTIAGVLNGSFGFSGDEGPARSATIGAPGSIAFDAQGSLFFADGMNARVRAVLTCTSLAPPRLLAPDNGATNQPTATTLRWDAVPGAFRYDVHLYPASGFPQLAAGNVTTTSYTAANLTRGQMYRWRIMAKGDPYCPSPSSASSEVRLFSVSAGCAAPGSFTLTAPTAGATGVAAPVTLSWAAAAGAGEYDVYLGATTPPPLVSTTTATSLPVSGLVAGASYYWNVVARAGCDRTLTTATPVRRFTLAGGCAAVGPFAPTEPADGAANVATTARLAWTPSANASGYDLYFGTTSPPPIYLFDLSTTSLEVRGLFKGRTYYWRVVARTACNVANTVATPVRSFTTAGQCPIPGATEIVFVPPGSVGVGQTYVVAWSEAPELDADGYYELQRSPAADFADVTDTQLTENTVAAFVPVSTGTYYHRVRAVAGCDTARTGPWSATRTVAVVGGAPNVIFTVQPEAVITNLGEKLEDKTARFTLENITSQRMQVIVGKAEINSPPFFTIVDPLRGDAVFVTLEPRVPKSFELHYSGPPNDETGSYQGLVLVSAPGAAIVPYAFVNLKVGSVSSAAPRFKVGSTPAEYAFFPGLAGDDTGRQPVTVTIENPGTTPMELGAEIGPEVWLVPEAGWNATPIPAGGSRDVRLTTQRNRAPNGSALPRYTYFTVRTRAGEKARLLVQDNGGSVAGEARSALPAPETRSYVVPEVVSGASAVTRLRLTNAGSDAVQTTLVYTPTGADGFDGAVVRSVVIVVPPNDVVTLTDPLRQVYGLAGVASGQIEVRAAPEKIGSITVTSALVAPFDATRLLGAIPVAWRGEGARADEDHLVPAVGRSAARRTALVLAETTGIDKARVRLTLTDAEGGTRGTKETTVPRYGRVEFADVVNELAPGATLSGATVTVDVIDGGGSVLALGKTTGATLEPVAIFVGRSRAEASGARLASLQRRLRFADESISLAQQLLLVPLVLSGKPSATAVVAYRTTMGLVAPKDAAALFTIRLRAATGASYSQTVSVGAGQTREHTDVVGDLFHVTGALQGAMTVSADAGASVWTSIATVPASGGDPVPSTSVTALPALSGVVTSSSPQEGRPLVLDGLEQSADPARGVAWNLYVNEMRGRSGIVTIRLYEAGNRTSPIAEKDFTLSAASQLSLETIFAAMGLASAERLKDRANVLVVISPKGGQALLSAIALATDIRTGQVQLWTLTPSGGVPASASLVGALRPAERNRPVRR